MLFTAELTLEEEPGQSAAHSTLYSKTQTAIHTQHTFTDTNTHPITNTFTQTLYSPLHTQPYILYIPHIN
jgi:hypothetical protein